MDILRKMESYRLDLYHPWRNSPSQIPSVSLSSITSAFLHSRFPHPLPFPAGSAVSVTLPTHGRHATCHVTFNPSPARVTRSRYKSSKRFLFYSNGHQRKIVHGQLSCFSLTPLAFERLYKIILCIIYSHEFNYARAGHQVVVRFITFSSQHQSDGWRRRLTPTWPVNFLCEFCLSSLYTSQVLIKTRSCSIWPFRWTHRISAGGVFSGTLKF